MQMKNEQIKTAGERRKLPGAGKHSCGCQQRWKVAVAAAAVFLPSLLSPLFLFSALSSVFFVTFSSSPCLFVVVSGGWRWQCQRQSSGVLWRWRGSTVASTVVLLL